MEINTYNNVKLGVIGCGNMASAIVSSVVNNGFIVSDSIYIYDINKESSQKLAEKLSLNIVESIDELLKTVNVIFIATKPFAINSVLKEMKNSYNNQLVLSILAGVKIETYLSQIPNIRIVRIMPNTPALINRGMSAICALESTPDDDLKFAYNFMKNCGEVIFTNEDKIDIITALSGSGPAFFYRLIELMAMSAHKLGLDYSQSLLLSAQTALGSAEMVINNKFDINQLIKNVTTPGGCTEVGNNILNNSKIDEILDDVIKSTMLKAKELG